MTKRTIGKLFTTWGLSGYVIDTRRLYSDKSRKAFGSKYDGGAVMFASVCDGSASFADIAHITYRIDSSGNAVALLHADIYFGDSTVFVKNANLEQLERTFNNMRGKTHA